MGTARLSERDRVGQLEALLRAREYAIASGDMLRQISAWNEVGGCMLFGPTPLAEVRGSSSRTELAWAREHDLPAVEADALLGGPYVDARRGDFARAREKLERSKAICRELGIAYGLAEAGMAGSELEVLAGDLPAAERELREAIDIAAGHGGRHYIGVYQVRLARVLHDQGRHEDAAAELEECQTSAGPRAAVEERSGPRAGGTREIWLRRSRSPARRRHRKAATRIQRPSPWRSSTSPRC